ncbi:MAG: adenosine deaminase [Pasteurellaceae bacterium]|nr:adenosine deaminase [Pasteurellaceae bacterium]
MQLAQYGIIDLHLHLDGSLSPEWMIEWAEKQQIKLPTTQVDQLWQYISVPQDCSSLNDYLRCFDLPISLLQTPEALTSAVKDLLIRLDKQGLVYAEIRFAPQFHTQQKMSQQDAIEAALLGLQQGLSATRLFNAKLILCCMRGEDNQAENLTTVELTPQYLAQGVAGLDLAGAEALYATENFAPIFNQAKKLNVPFTLHAGEAAGAESVQNALKFEPNRIGHGIRSYESKEVMAQLASKRIPLEMCPCSNLQTKTIRHLQDYPLRHYLQHQIVATINTDNMTVSNTKLAQEFQLLESDYQLTQAEAQQLLRNAIEAAFLTKVEKIALRKQIQQRYPHLLME